MSTDKRGIDKGKMSLTLDTAEVYDRLSIVEVKTSYAKKFETKRDLSEQILYLMNALSNFLGYDFSRTIYLSQEYKDLYEINRQLFDYIDKSKKDGFPASEIDKLNHKRYLAKKEIQEKYFGKLEEIKLGY